MTELDLLLGEARSSVTRPFLFGTPTGSRNHEDEAEQIRSINCREIILIGLQLPAPSKNSLRWDVRVRGQGGNTTLTVEEMGLLVAHRRRCRVHAGEPADF